jgi:hypothetical protein
VNIAHVMETVQYHFVIAMWRAKAAQWNGVQVAGTIKLNPPSVAAAIMCLSVDWFSAIFSAAFLTIIPVSAAVPQTSAEGMNTAEEWVVAQAAPGEMADLVKQFPEEKDRKLRAHFLEELLMGCAAGPQTLHRHGVQITGAIIDEPIDLTNVQVPCDVRLESCQFMSKATLSRASFTGFVSFRGSEFKGDATFSGMKVGGDADFDAAVFEGYVDFTGAQIAANFEMKEANFPGNYYQANFRSMKVAGLAIFDGARFEGPVDVSFADFGSLYLRSTHLSNAWWPKVYVDQFHYKYIKAGPNESGSHKALLELAKELPYSAGVYSNFEDFFYAKAIGPMQTKLSLKENVGSGNYGSPPPETPFGSTCAAVAGSNG